MLAPDHVTSQLMGTNLSYDAIVERKKFWDWIGRKTKWRKRSKGTGNQIYKGDYPSPRENGETRELNTRPTFYLSKVVLLPWHSSYEKDWKKFFSPFQSTFSQSFLAFVSVWSSGRLTLWNFLWSKFTLIKPFTLQRLWRFDENETGLSQTTSKERALLMAPKKSHFTALHPDWWFSL